MDVEKQQAVAEPVLSGTEDATTTDDELGRGDKAELQEKKEAIQLIEKKNGDAAAAAPNGDTKIKIAAEQEKGFSGMTKDELMKYANDPFWVRLRWFMFILFWVVWLAMLIGALMIIVYAPKCSAPQKLSWWQSGPLVALNNETSDVSADALSAIHATGLLYQVPADDTYDTEKMAAHKRAIEALAAANKDRKVIVDLIPNYVPATDDLYLKALVDKEQRGPFVWVEQSRVPKNWLALNGGSAWKQQNDSTAILSQFAPDHFDLQMNHAANKERLKKVIRAYGQLAAVCGFRLANTKHFLINPALADEEVNAKATAGYGHEDYQFWTHAQTTYVTGISDLLAELKSVARNATSDHCDDQVFFGAADSIEFIDLYATASGRLTVESVPVKLNLHEDKEAKNTNATSEAILRELKAIEQLRNGGLYLQYQQPEGQSSNEHLLFSSLLPGGVPVVSQKAVAEDKEKLAPIMTMRESASFTQGTFEMFKDASNQLVAYKRHQAGSPGYLVVYNPMGETVHGNFNATGISGDLTVSALSDNYQEEGITVKHKLFANDVPVSAHSVVVMTFVQDAQA